MLETRLDSKMQIRGKCSSNSLFTANSKFKRQKYSSVLRQVERQTRSRELKQSRWTNSLRLDVAAGRDSRTRKVQKSQSKKRIFLKSQVTTVRGKTNWQLVVRRTRLKYCKAGGQWAWYRTGVQVLGRRLERELVSHAHPRLTRGRQTEKVKGKGGENTRNRQRTDPHTVSIHYSEQKYGASTDV